MKLGQGGSKTVENPKSKIELLTQFLKSILRWNVIKMQKNETLQANEGREMFRFNGTHLPRFLILISYKYSAIEKRKRWQWENSGGMGENNGRSIYILPARSLTRQTGKESTENKEFRSKANLLSIPLFQVFISLFDSALANDLDIFCS